MILTSLRRWQGTPLFLVPLITGLLLTGMPPVAQAQVAEPVNTIATPADARAVGLESLRLQVIKDGGVPLPGNLNSFLKNTTAARKAALQLGKALFWDMQLGSDGIQACASCHFQAGADNRAKNQLNPDILRVKNLRDTTANSDVIGYHNAPEAPDLTFEVAGPNATLAAGDFPFVNLPNQFNQINNIIGPVTGNSNDVGSSQGVFKTTFNNVIPGSAVDAGTPVADPTWNVGGVNVRRVEPRNTPTTINAVFFFSNFWDGRANNKFNGVNPFGKQDPSARIYKRVDGLLRATAINMNNASLASQAVGPPLSPFEMSYDGRTWPAVGRKMLSLPPLAKQTVHPEDSVLGALANTEGEKLGLKSTVSYKSLIQAAFRNEYWDVENYIFDMTGMGIKKAKGDIFAFTQGKPVIVPRAPGTPLPPAGYTQMEVNFSFFFGIAVMLYEATLVSDQSPFDKWMEGTGGFVDGFGQKELDGLDVFVNKGKCINCHSGPEFSNASVRNAQGGNNVIEPMLMGDCNPGIYDNGFYNIAVTPTTDDLGRGNKDPFGNPLGFSRQFAFNNLGIKKITFPIIGALQVPNNLILREGIFYHRGNPTIEVGVDLNFNGLLDKGELTLRRVNVDGAFKTPGLRNIDLTGPYMHNGSLATLLQVVRFYDRGGNFCKFNMPDFDPDIQRLNFTEQEEQALVAFLVSLTDNRVKIQAAPFDHPSLLVPDGHPTDENAVIADPTQPLQAQDNLSTLGGILDAVGKTGMPGNPLKPFLGLDPFQDTNPEPVPDPCNPPDCPPAEPIP